MATFFGEVILPTSRVFFDDYDDSDEEECPSERNLEVKVLDENSLKHEFELLLIVEGTVCRGFADLYLVNANTSRLAEFYLPKEGERDNLVEITPHKEEPSVLFKLNDSTLLLRTSPAIDIFKSHQLTLKVAPWIERCKNIMTFNSRSVCDYQCEIREGLPSSFERTLVTSAVKQNLPGLSNLDQPNFITGFCASVAGWCECEDKPCILHTIFTDNLSLDSITFAPLFKIIEVTDLKHLIVNKPDSSKLGVSCDQSYMYM
ncbi:proteasome assembly chaperone 1 [Rhodnius prolixus]|uniref:Proteasome assembly chaperone 1 n=1 Tax=Rhodnius prolixus TaxID=13249 RepID=R4G318_RHOPR